MLSHASSSSTGVGRQPRISDMKGSQTKGRRGGKSASPNATKTTTHLRSLSQNQSFVPQPLQKNNSTLSRINERRGSQKTLASKSSKQKLAKRQMMQKLVD